MRKNIIQVQDLALDPDEDRDPSKVGRVKYLRTNQKSAEIETDPLCIIEEMDLESINGKIRGMILAAILSDAEKG